MAMTAPFSTRSPTSTRISSTGPSAREATTPCWRGTSRPITGTVCDIGCSRTASTLTSAAGGGPSCARTGPAQALAIAAQAKTNKFRIGGFAFIPRLPLVRPPIPWTTRSGSVSRTVLYSARAALPESVAKPYLDVAASQQTRANRPRCRH